MKAWKVTKLGNVPYFQTHDWNEAVAEALEMGAARREKFRVSAIRFEGRYYGWIVMPVRMF